MLIVELEPTYFISEGYC